MVNARFAKRATAAGPGLALGTMNFGKRTNEAESIKLIHLALERGVRVIDTANLYCGGLSESIVGRALKGRSDELILATKVGADRIKGKSEGLSKAQVLRSAEASFKRLGRERVDVFYLHMPDPLTPLEETLEAVAELLNRKLIGRFAVSNFASWQILELIELCRKLGLEPPALSQQLYNVLIRQLDLEYFRFAAKYQLHTTVYNPLAGGLLTARGVLAESVEAGSRFDGNRLYQQRYFTETLRTEAKHYASLAAAHGLSLLQLAYGFLAGHAEVDSVLVGPGSSEHLLEALEALAKPITAELRSEIDARHKRYLGTEACYAR